MVRFARWWSGQLLLLWVLVTGHPALAAKAPEPSLRSGAAIVVDDASGTVLYSKNPSAQHSIASITKLMTAMVVLDARQSMDESIEIVEDDKSRIKWTRSRLRIGSVVSRDDLLRLALMASDNRAAMALARGYPGGIDAAVEAMNAKVRTLGLGATRIADPTGLSSDNVSTPEDLAQLVTAARKYPRIKSYSTLREHTVQTKFGAIPFVNTNRLVRTNGWSIDLSKTGFIAEAGRCLVMHADVGTRPTTIVLLNAAGQFTSFADAHRIRQWLEPGYTPPRNATANTSSKSSTRGK